MPDLPQRFFPGGFLPMLTGLGLGDGAAVRVLGRPMERVVAELDRTASQKSS
ncbi:MAG: hypothetical protein ABSG91_20085 [Syntrophobacteraceae bacterium]